MAKKKIVNKVSIVGKKKKVKKQEQKQKQNVKQSQTVKINIGDKKKKDEDITDILQKIVSMQQPKYQPAPVSNITIAQPPQIPQYQGLRQPESLPKSERDLQEENMAIKRLKVENIRLAQQDILNRDSIDIFRRKEEALINEKQQREEMIDVLYDRIKTLETLQQERPQTAEQGTQETGGYNVLEQQLEQAKERLQREEERKEGIERELAKTELELERLKQSIIEEQKQILEEKRAKFIEGKPQFQPPEGSMKPIRKEIEVLPVEPQPAETSETLTKERKKSEYRQREEDFYKAIIEQYGDRMVATRTAVNGEKYIRNWIKSQAEGIDKKERGKYTEADINALKVKIEKYLTEGKFPKL